VLRHGGLTYAEAADERADRLFTVPKQFENRDAPWLGQGLKCREIVHGTNMPNQLYACQGIYLWR